MEEAPENGKEFTHFAHANGINEWTPILITLYLPHASYQQTFT
jgi:hypothetical protein